MSQTDPNLLKTLIIAEKPSVARDLSRSLGKFKNKDKDFFENDEYIISSALGHLVELYMPEDFDKKYGFWTIKSLPIIPEKFLLKPIEKTKKKLDVLKKLINRKDVNLVINACDSGREGELIFSYICELVNCKKKVQRLWMSSMTQEGIREAFKRLRTLEEMLPLQEAARCRSESDWLIGINGTRAVTSRMFGRKVRQVASVGRVQTPTLSMVCDREKEIQNFKPTAYSKIKATFLVTNGSYEGTYNKTTVDKNNEIDRVDRIWDFSEANAIFEAIENVGKATVKDDKKRTKQISPRLYDLTSIQKEANNRFGFPAGKTLKIVQSLYEGHKAVTYPRTDSKCLPEDYPDVCREILSIWSKSKSENNQINGLSSFAKKILDNNWINPFNKRIFNNKQISDHFAIIPTNQIPVKLTIDEIKIYGMITSRFVAAFFPAAEFDVTTRISQIEEHTFKSEGKVLVSGGWLDVYKRDKKGESEDQEKNSDDQNNDLKSQENNLDEKTQSNNSESKDDLASSGNSLPALCEKDGSPAIAKLLEANILNEQTSPPARYTEATLLGAMESAGKFIDDEELADAIKEKGLGTPATRAQIIDHLINLQYMIREGKELIPTAKGEQLIEFLKAVHLEELVSPSMTGEWEYKLRLIEKTELTREEFMKGISKMTSKIVESIIEYKESGENSRITTIVSPTDNLPLIETLRSYRSQDGKLTIYKTIGNRKIKEEEVAELIISKRIGPLDGFRSKAGKNFSASLELDENNQVKFSFDNQASKDGSPENLEKYPIIAQCPICKKGNIYETNLNYVCENHANKSCTVRISRILLNRPIPKEQFLKLIETGSTDLLDKLRSKRTGKLFSAYVVLNQNGEIGFKFTEKKKAAQPTPETTSLN